MTGNKTQQQSRDFSGNPIKKYLVEPFKSSNNPPWFDARGVAFGLLIGFGIPLGAQMVCLGLLRLILRFNVVIAFAFTWVNNPITLIPMYYAYYVIGSLLLGKPAVMTLADFHDLMKPVLQAQYFFNSVHAFMILGGDLLVRWFLAALSIAIPAAIVGYFVSYRVQRARCRSKAEKLGINYRKLLQQLEKEL